MAIYQKSKIAGGRWRASRTGGRLLLLPVILFCVQTGRAADPEESSVAQPAKYADFRSAFRSQMHGTTALPQVAAPPARGYQGILVGLASVVGAILAFRRLHPLVGGLLNRRFNPWTPAGAAVSLSEHILVEEQTYTEFAQSFQLGPKAASVPAAPAAHPKTAQGVADDTARPAKQGAADPGSQAREEFFGIALDDLAALRSLFSEIGRAPGQAARQRILADLCAQVGSLKTRLGALEVLPAWQMASALEGLLHQLADKPSNMTPSTLRTAGGGLVLLEALCVPGVRADLVKNPALRFLAVDDDPISRHAVSLSLKKAFQPPDLAENGAAALELAERQTYDIVFLDVEMPGMDGFEVCTKIRQTAANRSTPVVFVTSHSDFESRAKSTSSGGRDLIAKPFLSFEITVKALTLVLRSRLEQAKAGRQLETTSASLVETRIAPAAAQLPAEAFPAATSPGQEPVWHSGARPRSAMGHNQRSSERSASAEAGGLGTGETRSSAASAPDPRQYASAFAEHAPERLREMRAQLSALNESDDPGHRQEVLAEFYVGLHALTLEAERTGLKVAHQLASAIGKVVHKLIEKPGLFTPSALQAAATALHLLEELSAAGAEPDVGHPGVRVLIVDDDPVARRAISSALQLTMGRPEIAESGEAALVLAETRTFDVIFLDVIMPGMDGFATCSKIRETGLNSTTPVVFVTSQSDAESREKSVRFGGNGFITKPVLPAEIFLTALTFALRARMDEFAPA